MISIKNSLVKHLHFVEETALLSRHQTVHNAELHDIDVSSFRVGFGVFAK